MIRLQQSTHRITMSLRTLAMCGILVSSVNACSVGWQYTHNGTAYSMTQASIDYHKGVVSEVNRNFGVTLGVVDIKRAVLSNSAEEMESQVKPLKEQASAFQGACSLLKSRIANAPDEGGFVSASTLLTNDATTVCSASDEADAQVVRLTDAVKRLRDDERRKAELKAKEQEEEKVANAIHEVVLSCQKQMQELPCTIAGMTDGQRSLCSEQCRGIVAQSYRVVVSDMVKRCASGYFSSTPKHQIKCEVDLPAGFSMSDEKRTSAKDECVALCKEDVAETQRAAKAEYLSLTAPSRRANDSGSSGDACQVFRACASKCSFAHCDMFENCISGCMSGTPYTMNSCPGAGDMPIRCQQ